MTETANTIFERSRTKTKPWEPDEILKMCDQMLETEEKDTNNETKRESHRDARKHLAMISATREWIEDQCNETVSVERPTWNSSRKISPN